MFDFNDAEEQRSGFSGGNIPEGTVAVVVASIRPGGHGDDGIMRASDSGATMLDFEFTIQGGDYDRRKIWNLYVVDGHTEGHATAAKISKSALRAMLEAARNIKPDDMSAQAMEARKVSGYGDFNGLTFPVEIGLETGRLKDKLSGPNGERWPDKNVIRRIITPDMEEYSNPGASSSVKPSASKPSQSAAQASANKPSWAQ